MLFRFQICICESAVQRFVSSICLATIRSMHLSVQQEIFLYRLCYDMTENVSLEWDTMLQCMESIKIIRTSLSLKISESDELMLCSNLFKFGHLVHWLRINMSGPFLSTSKKELRNLILKEQERPLNFRIAMKLISFQVRNQ